jgi:hypothetical protein
MMRPAGDIVSRGAERRCYTGGLPIAKPRAARAAHGNTSHKQSYCPANVIRNERAGSAGLGTGRATTSPPAVCSQVIRSG